MEQIQFPDKSTPDQERFYKQLLDTALGEIIDLSAVPTGSALQAGQIGAYGTDIYIVTPNGVKIKLAGTSWS